jgi:hypothetical protein
LDLRHIARGHQQQEQERLQQQQQQEKLQQSERIVA